MWQKYLRIPEFMRISGKDVERVLLSLGLPEKAKVIDIGCGYARISAFLQSIGYDVIAIDIEDKMVEEAKKKGIKAFKMNAENLEFPEKYFDLAVTDGLLEHFRNPERILAEEARVSRKFVVNFIPKTNFINKILEKLQGTPQVFWRSKDEWISLHARYFKEVKVIELKRLWAFVCGV
jgi:ubiquinone/menaquinone biosynthesis C-methylase UbiE